MNNIKLKKLDKDLKFFLIAFLFTITAGIFTGIGYIYYTTSIKIDGIVERYNGSITQEYEIPENFPKSLENMLMTTHEHINAFAIISLLIGFIFYFNSIIIGKIKVFLMIEPFVSTIITFSSLWLLRYFNDSFSYVIAVSSGLMYLCWITMIAFSLYELIFIKE